MEPVFGVLELRILHCNDDYFILCKQVQLKIFTYLGSCTCRLKVSGVNLSNNWGLDRQLMYRLTLDITIF